MPNRIDVYHSVRVDDVQVCSLCFCKLPDYDPVLVLHALGGKRTCYSGYGEPAKRRFWMPLNL